MWSELQERHWYVLPALSGALLVLAFYPYNFWPLIFVALAPLFYFAASFPKRPLRKVFYGGCIAGGMLALSLSLNVVLDFKWTADQYFFITAVRLSFVLLAAIGGIACGLALTVYRLLRSRYALLNGLLAASAYAATEMLLYRLYGEHNFALLAYTVTPLPVLMVFAWAGGIFLVSFIIAWGNAVLAEAWLRWYARPAMGAGAILSFALGIVLLGTALGTLNRPATPVGKISLAIIQLGDTANKRNLIGKEREGIFMLPALESTLEEAAKGAPDLLLYPFSPTRAALYDGKPPSLGYDVSFAHKATVAAWFALRVPASTTVMIWTAYFNAPVFYDELEFFQDGKPVMAYQKRELSPFLNYTPAWARALGMRTTIFDAQSGAKDQRVTAAGAPAAAAICSEIYAPDIVRADAARSSYLISVGTESIVGNAARVFSLKAAQFRAAENNIPVIRANILGPSAIIDRKGSVTAFAPSEKETVLRGTLEVTEPAVTPFSRLGNTPLIAGICFIFAAAMLQRRIAAGNV